MFSIFAELARRSMVSHAVAGKTMPRFYFDYSNGDMSQDDEGVELASLEVAKQELRESLPAMLRDESRGHDKSRVMANVRDESGTICLTASITLRIVEKNTGADT